jgi:predicted permease
MGTLLQDIRYGTRMLIKNPGFTAVAVLSLALGIGANAAIFSFVDALLLRTLPIQDPQALVFFGPADASGNSGGFPDDNMDLFSYQIYREMAQKNKVFSGVTAVNSWSYHAHGVVGNSGELEPLSIQLVSGTYFNVLGVDAVLGRTFTESDDQVLGGHPVAVISYDWWTNRFSRDPGMVGKTFKIGDTIYTIIGIAPRGFLGTTVGESQDMWIPLQMADKITQGPHKLNDKFYRSLDIIARLKPGVSLKAASANTNVILKGILEDYAGPQPSQEYLQDMRQARVELTPASTGKSLLRDQFGKPLWILMSTVGMVLLIACANIANLLLARGAMRQREIAVRMALGAGPARLIRQFLTESLIIAAMGGGLGVLFASWSSHLLLAMASTGSDTIQLSISPDVKVVGFTFVVSVFTVVLFGIVPAVQAARVAPNVTLAGGRSANAGQRNSLLGKALIVTQVSLSLVLLIGAGLFVRSLINLAKVDTGFQKKNVLLFRIDSRATGFTDELRLANFYRQVEERSNTIPGVKASSFSIFAFNQGAWDGEVWAESEASAAPTDRRAWFNAVGPGYFATMALPILDGHGFAPQDTSTSPRVAVINETMARSLFPGSSAVGKRFGMSGGEHNKDIEVIGVVPDSKYFSLDEEPRAIAYYPYTQYSPDWGIGLYLGDFQVRSMGDSRAVISGVRESIAEVNPNTPVVNVQTLAERVDDSVSSRQLVALLSGFFGLLAVFLACIGIYGLTSFSVNRRTNEIGIRMALGASQTDVLSMVMSDVVTLVVIGLAIGVPVALATDRWIASLLFGLKPADPLTLAAAAAFLLGVAALAGFLPARRAMRVDPMVALRYE